MLAAVVVAACSVASPGALAQDANDYTVFEDYFASGDHTLLHAYVLRPANLGLSVKTPVIVTATPYGNSGGRPDNPKPANQEPPDAGSLGTKGRIFERGYTFVIASLRGYGGSSGCYDMGGAGEQADVKAAVEWAAGAPWSDGRVGMWGHSYPAWSQVMALATKPAGLRAVVASSAPIGYENLYTNRVRHPQWISNGATYARHDLQPPSVFSPPMQWTNAFGGTLSDPACYAKPIVLSASDDPRSQYWAEREIVSHVTDSTIPALWAHGLNDNNVYPDQFLPVWSRLAGPHRAFLGPWEHGINGLSGQAWIDEAVGWFDCYVRETGSCPAAPAVEVQSLDGTWRAEDAWPPADSVAHPIPLLDGSYVDAAGNNGETRGPRTIPGPVQPGEDLELPTGRGAWTFTQPLPYDLHISGLPRLEATVQPAVPEVHLIALLYDVDANGRAAMISRGAFRVHESGPVAFELFPQDWRMAASHRIGVLVSGADDLWFLPNDSGTTVTFSQARLLVPFLGSRRDTPLPAGPFLPRTPPPPSQIDQETIDAHTLPATWPPEPR
jgi:hypothetical protein